MFLSVSRPDRSFLDFVADFLLVADEVLDLHFLGFFLAFVPSFFFERALGFEKAVRDSSSPNHFFLLLLLYLAVSFHSFFGELLLKLLAVHSFLVLPLDRPVLLHHLPGLILELVRGHSTTLKVAPVHLQVVNHGVELFPGLSAISQLHILSTVLIKNTFGQI